MIVALLITASASAQRHSDRVRGGEYQPTVYLISAQEVDTIYTCPAQRTAAMNNLAAVNGATQDYIDTYRPGFQQVDKPQFVFASKNNRFSLAIGGFVQTRVAYDFDGLVDNLDFVTYDIPVVGNYATKQKLIMDASTSRIYLKGIINTSALGRVVIFMENDFRGGSQGNYDFRLRAATVSFLGLTFGRDLTTFCDLTAAPLTIDFQGPNAYNINYTTMIRYEKSFANNHMTVGGAAELPEVSGTYGTQFEPIPQRVPDFIAYLQYAWGANRDSHIRATGVVRDMYLHNARTDKNTSLLGWGAQFSGNIKVCRFFQLFMNGTYGEGITPYIQDLAGSGYDFTPDPRNADRIQTMPMWGWQAAGQLNFTKRLWVSGGYSEVYVEKKHGFYADDQYKHGQYIFGNLFYAITPRCKVAAEYLYGTRKDMDNKHNHANRVNMMVQYNF